MGVSRSIGVIITPPSPYLYTGLPLSYKKKYDNGTTEGGRTVEGNRGAMVTPIPRHTRICTQQDTPDILPDTGGLLFCSHITTGYCDHVSLRDVKMPGNGPIRAYGRFFVGMVLIYQLARKTSHTPVLPPRRGCRPARNPPPATPDNKKPRGVSGVDWFTYWLGYATPSRTAIAWPMT